MIFILISWWIVLLYVLVILRFYWAWIQIKDKEIRLPYQKKISIIIAIRNEEEHLAKLFQSLTNLNYSKSNFEVILVNDHSDDNSSNLMEQFKCSNSEMDITLSSLSNNEIGKKTALKTAFSLAKYDIIQCTDGDCEIPRSWLQICASAFEDNDIKMISGGIELKHNSSIFQRMQALELLSLIASGGAAIGMQKPIMCNGANMAFRKEILKLENKETNDNQYASGDDVFFLEALNKRLGANAISFIKNHGYWVKTIVEPKVSGWINQRIRWVSKSKGYKDAFLIFTSLLVLFTNLTLIILFIAAFFNFQLASTLLYLFLLKGLTDFIFLKQASSDSLQKHLLKFFIPMSFIYPFFISYTAIVGQFKSFTWKDRNYKK